ncbi:MAG: 3-oxoadipate enol-lactonase [Rhodospirillaceae bacterium]|nr:3-oxoadipate enol-lactonase [Rhodospirillaceae bacterium]|tara:strand:+ start:1958 stop:2743 length:786 start_codon:yes stop_codon:yes gene_type:complete
MKVHANGIDINCEISGTKGKPWITFSHALCNNLSLWDEQAQVLNNDFQILRYDIRGLGRSESPRGPYTFPMIISDAIALLDHFGIKKTHWCGLSIGGMMGYGLCQDHGDRILSLIACDSRPDAPPEYQEYFQHRIDVAAKKGMEGLVESTIERWFTPESVAANIPILDKVRNMIRSTDQTGHAGCCEALKTLAFGSRLGEIKNPTLLIGGTEDKGAPPDALAQAAASIPGAKHVQIPDAGHISNLENPEAFNKALVDFLTG